MPADVDSVELRMLSCPRDGTILAPEIHKNCDGRYECPTCNNRYDAHKVIP